MVRIAGPRVVRPLPPPPEEARLRGRLHSPARDAAAIEHHYDLSNEFYRILLGPSMTYSCAVWSDDASTLEDAQWAKHELVCVKLGLAPGQRLLDIGSGWGSMVMHAAEEHGARAVGVTISRISTISRPSASRRQASATRSTCGSRTTATSPMARTTS